MSKLKSLFCSFVFISLSFFLFSRTANSLPPGVGLELEEKAAHKACFCGIGDSNNGPISNSATGDCSDLFPAGDGASEPADCSCPNDICGAGPSVCALAGSCIPKVNESYPWGFTKVGNILWWGTFNNVQCAGGTAFFSIAFDINPSISRFLPGVPESVCEFEFGPSAPLLGAGFGDSFPPPSIYTFNTTTNSLSEKTVAGCPSFTPGFTAEDLLAETVGLRSAGSIGDFVFFAGPALNGVNMFAFKASTEQCIGAKNFSQYNDVRKWLTLLSGLYVGLGNTSGGGGGTILRWAGSLANPFNFLVVGKTDGPVANIAAHSEGGKIYIAVTTWPNLGILATGTIDGGLLQTLIQTLKGFASLYLSPAVPISGLTSTHANQWKKVWQILTYEPGIVTAASIGGGDLASYGGWLFWGLMQVPFTGFIAHALILEPDLLEPTCFDADPTFPSNDCETRFSAASTNTNRATSVFRGKNLTSFKKKIELLYGEKDYFVYLPNQGWITQPNRMFQTPKFGASGIGTSADPDGGNPSAYYSWTAKVWNNKLWWGVFDATNPLLPEGGADLWFFDGNDASEFQNAFFNGGINTRTWGVRTMVADDCLYLGMANGYSLSPVGGWEILKLFPTDPAVQATLGCFPTP